MTLLSEKIKPFLDSLIAEEAYKLSHYDRKKSDQKTKDADEILQKINALEE